MSANGPHPEDEEKMKEMQGLIADLEQAKSNEWEEKERLHKMYEEERKRNLENEQAIISFFNNVKDTEESKNKMERLKAATEKQHKIYKKEKKRIARMKEDHDKIIKLYKQLEINLKDPSIYYNIYRFRRRKERKNSKRIK